jgi:predicted amidohydrolase
MLPSNVDLTTRSSIIPDSQGMVEVFLVQTATGQTLIGNRDGPRAGQAPRAPTEDQVVDCRTVLNETRPGTLTVLSFHPGLRDCADELRALAADRTVVGLAGIGEDGRNLTYVATSGELVAQAKLSLSSEDENHGVRPGDTLHAFVPRRDDTAGALRWAVLNCHDYTDVELLRVVQDHGVEVLVVVTYNAATRLYWEYATADIHRLFCYIVIANVAELGGSAVFAPFRRIGLQRNAQFGAGGQVFGARGPGRFGVRVPLDVGELRRLKEEFTQHGVRAKAVQRSRDAAYAPVVPVVPPERYLNTFDRPAGVPPITDVVEIRTAWNWMRPRVAVAQLHHMGLDAYIDTRYRIRAHRSCAQFEDMLTLRLQYLERQCLQRGRTSADALLDLLVLPEVFVPRSFLGALQDFSDRTGSMVIAGVDYPDGGDDQNANECVIIRAGERPEYYRKITRSQYDALRDRTGEPMPLQRGDRLVRLVGADGGGLGVLICYDFSHLELMHALNLRNRSRPLDLTVVVAHNPYGGLYRSCCIADAHRFYQYVVMCNVAEYGGSGIFSPLRTPGARQVICDAGQGVEAVALAELDLVGLREARATPDDGLHAGVFMRRPGVFKSRTAADAGAVPSTHDHSLSSARKPPTHSA